MKKQREFIMEVMGFSLFFLLVIYLKVFEKIGKLTEKVESHCRILYYES